MHIFRFVVLIGLILTVRCQVESILAKLCGENEIFTCEIPCIETCDYKPEICTKNCLFDCFCQPGYVRQSNQTGSPCIKRRQCLSNTTEPKCCRNQEYSECGSACPSTCQDFAYPIKNSARICPAVCVSGCFCKQGFYRSSSGSCVTSNACCRGENEGYQACGTACPATCENPNPSCTRECVQGCFCKSMDYVRETNSTGSRCILREQCSPSKL